MRVARSGGELAQRSEGENERGGAGCAGADHAANVVAAAGPGNDARSGSRPFTVVAVGIVDAVVEAARAPGRGRLEGAPGRGPGG
jgi:hypothetical protein